MTAAKTNLGSRGRDLTEHEWATLARVAKGPCPIHDLKIDALRKLLVLGYVALARYDRHLCVTTSEGNERLERGFDVELSFADE